MKETARQSVIFGVTFGTFYGKHQYSEVYIKQEGTQAAGAVYIKQEAVYKKLPRIAAKELSSSI